MPTRTAVPERLEDAVAGIFQQVQINVASHKKNVVQLHKLHQQAAEETETTTSGNIRLAGEKRFNHLFQDMVYKVLPVKKGTSEADRVVRFVGSFVKYTVEKGNSTPFDFSDC
jgi:condensin complex subunit 3